MAIKIKAICSNNRLLIKTWKVRFSTWCWIIKTSGAVRRPFFSALSRAFSTDWGRISNWTICKLYLSVHFSSVAQSCPTVCNSMNRSTPGLPVHHHLPEFTQTHVHRVRDSIQPSHPLSSPSPPAPNLSQHQSLFQWVNSSHKVSKVLELQL